MKTYALSREKSPEKRIPRPGSSIFGNKVKEQEPTQGTKNKPVRQEKIQGKKNVVKQEKKVSEEKGNCQPSKCFWGYKLGENQQIYIWFDNMEAINESSKYSSCEKISFFLIHVWEAYLFKVKAQILLTVGCCVPFQQVSHESQTRAVFQEITFCLRSPSRWQHASSKSNAYVYHKAGISQCPIPSEQSRVCGMLESGYYRKLSVPSAWEN